MASSQQQTSKPGAPVPVVPNNVDNYLVIHVATTCDEHGVYVTKDSAEVIEIGWVLVDAKTLDEKYRESVLVKPMNTPITPLCKQYAPASPPFLPPLYRSCCTLKARFLYICQSGACSARQEAWMPTSTGYCSTWYMRPYVSGASLTTLTWDNVRNAGTFREAITRLDQFVSEKLGNSEFVFVTFENWDLRVQLPREARDKAVVLPAYLQHSRLFDLKIEYTHWQVYHPESLPFGASSLSNICAALEVEPLQTSPPIKHNLPFHLQALAPASPRRALEEAITLARVLKGLVQKSQPHHDHPDVLMHPFDARADVRSFLAERSKVLFMSGLPHDTTQSELESWFTQYGGRPIAFWTMRTPDQHKPTGSGFAIFSSHEEAAESLCMNGRALSEKAIEVSPSSHHVLDRAAEVLTPFPPSKNRPRPGDWTCPSCGFSNFQRRTQCFRCSYPAMSAGGGQSDPNMGGGYGYGYNPQPQFMPSYGPGGHANHRVGGSAPFRPGDWRCGQQDCLYHNFAKNVNCLRCGASRSGAHVSNGPTINEFQPAYPPPFGMGPHDPSAGPGGHPGPMGAPMPGPGGFPSNHGGFPGAASFGPPGYGMPSGPNPYPHPMGGFAGPAGGLPPATGFDSRAEAAFSGAAPGGNAGPGANQPSGPQPGGFSNGGGSAGYENPNDPFSFLTPGLGSLNIDDSRRNGGGPTGKNAA
ncbi:hypothetical protein BT63DRAFT_467497 [Microthyrium microscopicum]|uniref:RNA-binding domain-containing protein n=1 Tax=Microthyrium microscopicum TaxID=703497 RepID=A0A6A6UR34_9PEZI|nr:hypothetical protein BT63DRAFT_467497 [Microthyrium microscopicum]